MADILKVECNRATLSVSLDEAEYILGQIPPKDSAWQEWNAVVKAIEEENGTS